MTPDRGSPGTVFALPLGDGSQGVGQVVYRLGDRTQPFFVAVFEGVHDDDQLDHGLAQPVVLLALTMDALLNHERWPVLGHRDVDEESFALPAYREDSDDQSAAVVVDYSGHRRKRVDRESASDLPYRTVVAPVRVDKAFRALHGQGTWDDIYDELRPPDPDRTSRAVFGPGQTN